MNVALVLWSSVEGFEWEEMHAREGFLGGPWQIESSVTAVWMPAKPPICFRIAGNKKFGPIDGTIHVGVRW